jgi:putative ABC transport system substrate-binding protein
MIRRREFITLLGGAAASPLAARAQQPATPVIGHIHDGVPDIVPNLLAAFRKGLSETGYVEGRNVAIEYRYSYNDHARLAEAVADLVRRRVSVIATPNSQDAAGAAKAATTTIPIVFGGGTDPVKSGLVASYNRPGGNVTGVITMNAELVTKRLGLLHQLLPRATRRCRSCQS